MCQVQNNTAKRVYFIDLQYHDAISKNSFVFRLGCKVPENDRSFSVNSKEEHLCQHLSPLKSWLRFVFSFSLLFTNRFLASWLRKEPKTFHFRIINPWKPSAASDISLQRERNKMLLFYYIGDESLKRRSHSLLLLQAMKWYKSSGRTGQKD